jgi:hypothetical protein
MGSGSFARFGVFYCVLCVPQLVFHFWIYFCEWSAVQMRQIPSTNVQTQLPWDKICTSWFRIVPASLGTILWKVKWSVFLTGQVAVFYTWPTIWSGPFSDNDIKSLGHKFSVMGLLIGSEFVIDFRTWIDKLNLSVFSCFTTYVPFGVQNRGKYGTMGERTMERWREGELIGIGIWG